MMIAYSGDWHGNTRYAVAVIEKLSLDGADRIVHVGDFGYNFEPEFLDSLTVALDDAGITLYFVDGNHENFDVLYSYPVDDDGLRRLSPNIIHMPRGFRWEWDGTTYLALGGAFSVDKNYRLTQQQKSWWAEEHLTDEDVDNAIKGGPVDVMVCHDAPLEVEIPGLDSNDFGLSTGVLMQADAHRAMVSLVYNEVKPRLLVHGHYHRRYTGFTKHGMVIGLDCDGTRFTDNTLLQHSGEDSQSHDD